MTNAPVFYQTIVNNILAKYFDIFAVIYLDDIFIYSKILEKYIRYIKTVFDKLRSSKLLLGKKKYEFHKHEVDFLGFIVEKNGIKMDLEKMQKIQEWPVPKNVKNIQGFLGFGNFNRRFITNYSTIAILLIEFTKKDVPFIWITTQQKVFDIFKKVFTSTPCLAIFKSEKSVRIEIDTSDKRVKTYILQ